MKAFKHIGIRSSLRFLFEEFLKVALNICFFPPLRTVFLRVLGTHIGKGCVIHHIDFINFYRGSFKNVTIGDDCYIGNHVLFDLANSIFLGNQVTISERVVLMTHMNVGYSDHPLQSRFPPIDKPVSIGSGSFIGVNATILAGVTIGPETFVASGAVVNKNFDGKCILGGVPAKLINTY